LFAILRCCGRVSTFISWNSFAHCLFLATCLHRKYLRFLAEKRNSDISQSNSRTSDPRRASSKGHATSRECARSRGRVAIQFQYDFSIYHPNDDCYGHSRWGDVQGIYCPSVQKTWPWFHLSNP
jgi:hypothetical protein